MNTTEMIEHVERCIARANRKESRLDDFDMAIANGWGKKFRHFLNNLASIEGVRYLEIGLHLGATTSATLKANRIDYVGCDHWGFWGGEDKFYANARPRFGENKVSIAKKSCWELTAEDVPHRPNFYMYDADHSWVGQHDALTKISPLLADEFVYVCDDLWHPSHVADVEPATRKGIEDAGLEVVKEWLIGKDDGGDAGWHHGVYVAVLKKGRP